MDRLVDLMKRLELGVLDLRISDRVALGIEARAVPQRNAVTLLHDAILEVQVIPDITHVGALDFAR